MTTAEAASAPGLVRMMPSRIWLCIGLAALVLPTLVRVAQEHWTSDDGAHGPILLATALWLLWRARATIEAHRRPVHSWGWTLLLLPLLLLPVRLETRFTADGRALRVRIASEERWVAVEDAGRLRDALGTALPVGVAEAFLEPVKDPVGDLVSRYARTHGPFHPADVAARFGMGIAVVDGALARLATSGRQMRGHRA